MGQVVLRMIRAVVAILLGVSLSRAGPAQISMGTQAADEVFTVDLSNEPRNAGRPLGEADFFLASQLPRIPTNMTSERLMKLTAEGELRGSMHKPEPDLADVLKATKNGVAALENHWANGIVPYTLDAAFTTSEWLCLYQDCHPRAPPCCGCQT